MRLFIAEKPSLARAIAEGIGSGSKSDGYISLENGGTIVTWCFGHILEQLNPDEYDDRYKVWKMEDLPIVPDPWKLKVRKDAAKQFKIIKGLISKADFIINAGDPDREGQLLIDEVLEYVGNKKPVKRILLNALDDKSVKQALNDLRNNQDFIGLKNSALARSRADWLVGMNLSRAYTIIARAGGYNAVSVGRVQTPTMAIVVRREAEIKNFTSVKHYQLGVVWHHENGDIPTAWQMPKDMDGLDSENRLLKREVVDDLLQSLQGSTGNITSVETAKKKVGQRLPYSLSSLQIEAGRRYGYSPQLVLDTMQALYEKKLTTYPRSDCEYLPENQFSDASAVLKNLSSITHNNFSKLVAAADSTMHSRAWNDKKISAHHALIPTIETVHFDSLSGTEQNLYYMVAQAYLAQFYPIHTYESTKIVIQCGENQFSGTGKQILENGWKSIYTGKEAEDEKEDLPLMPNVAEHDSVSFKDGKVQEKNTKPPAHFTEATLLKAMKEIYKYLKDENLKAELKECNGIGTEATRAGIIERLQTAGFLHLDGKYLMPTEKAAMAVKVLPEEITYPDTTAIWEKELEEVSEGRTTLESFFVQQERKIDQFLAHAKASKITASKDAVLCPNCKKPMVRRKGKNGFFWGCTGYPECKTTCPDKKGKPDFNASKSGSSVTGLKTKCPICGKELRQIKWKSITFWGCEDKECKTSFDDYKNNPVIVKCPTCKKGYLRRYASKKKKGEFYWACTDHNCKTFVKDKNGLPETDK